MRAHGMADDSARRPAYRRPLPLRQLQWADYWLMLVMLGGFLTAAGILGFWSLH